jgi:hypothetical protein
MLGGETRDDRTSGNIHLHNDNSLPISHHDNCRPSILTRLCGAEPKVHRKGVTKWLDYVGFVLIGSMQSESINVTYAPHQRS